MINKIRIFLIILNIFSISFAYQIRKDIKNVEILDEGKGQEQISNLYAICDIIYYKTGRTYNKKISLKDDKKLKGYYYNNNIAGLYIRYDRSGEYQVFCYFPNKYIEKKLRIGNSIKIDTNNLEINIKANTRLLGLNICYWPGGTNRYVFCYHPYDERVINKKAHMIPITLGTLAPLIERYYVNANEIEVKIKRKRDDFSVYPIVSYILLDKKWYYNKNKISSKLADFAKYYNYGDVNWYIRGYRIFLFLSKKNYNKKDFKFPAIKVEVN